MKCKVHAMSKKLLTADLVKEYLEINKFPPEAIQFVIDIFPLYPQVVYVIGNILSESGINELAIKQWYQSQRDLLVLTEGELGVIDKKLGF